MLLLMLACRGPTPPPAPRELPEVQVTARLVAERGAPKPGEPFWLAVHYTMAPGWHIYWENPGETGLATTATLTGPEGFDAPGAPSYPGPERFVSPGDITSYGYEGEAALLFRVGVPEAPGPGPHRFTARTDWLACREVCIKGGADLALDLPGEGARLDAFVQALPRPFDRHAGATLTWSPARDEALLRLPGVEAAELLPGADLALALAEALPGQDGHDATLTLRFKSPLDRLPPGVLRLTPRRGDPLFLQLPETSP